MARRVFVIALTVAFAFPAARDAPAAFLETPSLHVVSIRPFKVRGLDFRPRELVRVVVVSDVRSVRVVRATVSGGFLADFGALRIDPCTGFTVVAKGDRGSRAARHTRALPECPQAAP
jgi:hypothetical protein